MSSEKYKIKEGVKPCNFLAAMESMVCDNCIFESIENIYKMEENILKYYSESDKVWKENQLSFNRLFNEKWWLCEEIDDVVDKKSCETCKEKNTCDILYAIKYASQEVNESEFYCSRFERKED